MNHVYRMYSWGYHKRLYTIWKSKTPEPRFWSSCGLPSATVYTKVILVHMVEPGLWGTAMSTAIREQTSPV